MVETRKQFQGGAEGLAGGLDVGRAGKRGAEFPSLGPEQWVDGKMRKGKVSVPVLGGTRGGEEGKLAGLFCAR